MSTSPSESVNRPDKEEAPFFGALYLCLDDVEGDGPCHDMPCSGCGKVPSYRFQWRQTSYWVSSLWLCPECGERQRKAMEASRNGGAEELQPPAVLTGSDQESRSEPLPGNATD